MAPLCVFKFENVEFSNIEFLGIFIRKQISFVIELHGDICIYLTCRKKRKCVESHNKKLVIARINVVRLIANTIKV